MPIAPLCGKLPLNSPNPVMQIGCMVNYETVGSCRMGNDGIAVVNDKLQVHGVDGLRVIDGSVMPRITTGDPSATIIMIAEKAADLILELATASDTISACGIPKF
jgi:choline dehydrogenase